jgi:hypothetical protein
MISSYCFCGSWINPINCRSDSPRSESRATGPAENSGSTYNFLSRQIIQCSLRTCSARSLSTSGEILRASVYLLEPWIVAIFPFSIGPVGSSDTVILDTLTNAHILLEASEWPHVNISSRFNPSQCYYTSCVCPAKNRIGQDARSAERLREMRRACTAEPEFYLY